MIDDDGEESLLERMVHTLVGASTDESNFSDGPNTAIQNTNYKPKEMNLVKLLSTVKNFDKELEDQLPFEYDVPIDVLYQRRAATPFSFAEKHVSASSWESQFKNEMIEPPMTVEDDYNPKRHTNNVQYRLFMEEVVFIKSASKEILEVLEDTKKILSQEIRIKHDPGFGRINLFQAWVWICKEANMASCSALNDKTERKKLHTFISEKFAKCAKKCRQLRDDMKNLQKAYEKVVREFKIVNQKYHARFFDNLTGAKDFELDAPGHGFFSHKTESSETTEVCEPYMDQDTKSDHNTQEQQSNEKSLKVRLGIDGVTLRSSTGNWLKVQSVNKHQDKEILYQIFINAMLEPCKKAMDNNDKIRDNLAPSNKEKELHKYPSHSIFQSVHKLKMVLDATSKKSHFLPKEEVCMLYTLKSARAVFDLITPVCVDVIILTERILNIGSTLISKKSFFKSHKSNHAPLDRLMRIEVEVKNTSIDVTTMLNRYPNIRNAKKFRDKLLQNTEDVTDELDCNDDDDDLQVETLYTCAPDEFSTYSVNPLPESMLITQTQLSADNSAKQMNSETNSCHMFDDFELEYKNATTKLATTRQIQPHMVTLCSDSIRMFYESAEDMRFWKTSVLENIEYAVENLLYGLSGESTRVPSSFWIQLMCKYIQNWDFHMLPKHFKRHFYDLNDYSLSWIHKLEVALGEFTQLVLTYKNDLTDYHSHMELIHGFTTWIRKDFHFDPKRKMIERWNEEAKNTDSLYIDLSKPVSQYPTLLLDFTDSDMKLIVKSASGKTQLLTLNQSSNSVQIGLVSLLFAKLDEISRRAIVNINSATTIYQQHIHLIKLRSTAQSELNSAPHSNFHQLENLVLALTLEMMHKDLRETIGHITFLNDTIGQFNSCFQLVQLQLEDREIIVNETDTFTSKHNSKKQEEAHYKHDTNLDETTQLLRKSISNMPNIYEIKQESTINSFKQWVKIALRDTELLDDVNSLPIPPEQTDEMNSDDHNVAIDSSKVKINGIPIKLQEAMTHAASGNGFFPDPTLFTTDEERWRNLCFDLLSIAVNNFGELTTSKLIDVNVLLHYPRASEENLTQSLKSSSLLENESRHSIDHHQRKPKKSIPFVGYAEGLCVLLWFISRNLSERDRGFVTSEDLKLLKINFSSLTDLVNWFVKDMQEAEKFLINNLSLAMASIEFKMVPRDIAICPNDEDFLKSHDLEEIGSRHDKSAAGKLPMENGINDDIEFRWDSSNRQILFCRYKNNDTWMNFSEIHVQGQLKTIHMIIDQLNKEFKRSRELVKAAKKDMARAKELLENTWKGIAKDTKRERVPKCSILVMLKLYRHQIANAAKHTKRVLKTTREVGYLLSQSVEYTRRWASESPTPMEQISHKNYVMKSENLLLNLTITASTSPHNWLIKDVNKTAQPTTVEPRQVPQYKITTEAKKNIIDIKYAVQVESSTSIDVHDDTVTLTHHQPCPRKAMPTSETGWKGKVFGAEENILLSPLANSFNQNASSIERLLMTSLRKIIIVLTLPNCNVSETNRDVIPNITGVLTALVGATMSIRFFKDIVPLQRNDLIKSLHDIEMKAGKLRSSNGTIGFIYTESNKILKSTTTLDASFRNKFCPEDETPPVNEIEFSPAQPIYGIIPLELLEEIAMTIAGRVWTVITGVPNLGTVIKDNKTLESQVLSNIPLACKVEVLRGIINFLNKVFDQISTHMEIAKKDAKKASTFLKVQNKELTKKLKHVKNIQTMDKGEISEHLQGFARIIQACKEVNKLAEEITELIESSYEILIRVKGYLGLKFQSEPVGGFVTVDNDMLTRAKNWHTLEKLTGVTNAPPHPVLVKNIVKRQAQDHLQATYKTALENKMLELELYFGQLFAKHVAVNIPIRLAPSSEIMRLNDSHE